MLKIGVLGAGFMGGTHARAFAQVPDVQVVALSSRSPEKAAALAADVGAEPLTDAMAVINHPAVEAVSITLPTNLHCEYAVAALNAGKHVLVEKPMALTTDECDAMIEAAQKNERILMVAHVLRFWPEYVALAEMLASGRLGRPVSATAARLCSRPNWSEWFAHADWTGGGIQDLHIHDLDALNWLFGRPQTVYARGQRGMDDGWDQSLTLLDYGDVKCFAEGNQLLPEGYPFTMTLAVMCEQGAIEINVRAEGGQVDSIGGSRPTLMLYQANQPPQPVPFAAGDGYYNQVAYFAECVRAGRAPARGTAEQGRLAIATVQATRRSLETNQVVAL